VNIGAATQLHVEAVEKPLYDCTLFPWILSLSEYLCKLQPLFSLFLRRCKPRDLSNIVDHAEQLPLDIDLSSAS
jgi:hypothetical protein